MRFSLKTLDTLRALILFSVAQLIILAIFAGCHHVEAEELENVQPVTPYTSLELQKDKSAADQENKVQYDGDVRIMFSFVWLLFSLLILGFVYSYNNWKKKNSYLVDKLGLKAELDKNMSLENSKYMDIFNNTDEGILIHHPVDCSLLDVNQTVCDLFGYTREEFISMDIGQFSADYGIFNFDYAKNKIYEAVEKGHVYAEWHAKKKDGTLFWVNVHLKKISIAGKDLVLALMNDVTEMKKFDRERTQLIEIIENTSDLVSTSNREKEVLYINEAGKKMIGLDDGNCCVNIPDLHPQWATDIIANEGIPSAIKDGIWEGETAILTTDDREIPVSQVILAHKDSNGGIECLSTIIRDITEIRNKEEELRQSAKLLSTTLCSVADAVITTDTDSRVIFMNPVAIETTGWNLSEVEGLKLSNVFIVIDEDTNDFISDPVVDVIKDRKHKKFGSHYRLQTRHKEELPISFICSPILDGDSISGSVLVFREISDERRIEAQQRHQQKLEALGTLAGGVAHEINNPINVIMNYAELIMDQLDEASDSYEDVKQIISESSRIATIVRNLLSFSRQEEEYKSMARIIDIVNSTSSLTSKLLKKDQVELDIRVSEELPYVRCRSQEIMQVLMNLITNARDALNAKYPGYDDNKVISITADQVEHDESPYLRLTVEDKGTGIEPHVMDKMYDPFFSSKPRDKGTGLGLSISHGIIRDHNGFLTCETERDSYTRFHIDLPL